MAEELIDVVDKRGRKTGIVVTKKAVHEKGLWHQTADVWIYNSKGEVLFQKRSKTKETFPEMLDVSAAGHVSAGETPKGAALRELKEELGITAHSEDLKKLFASGISYRYREGYYIKHFFNVYLLKLNSAPRTLQKEEVEGVEFVSLDKFEMELKIPELAKKYVPHVYYPRLIRALRKRLK